MTRIEPVSWWRRLQGQPIAAEEPGAGGAVPPAGPVPVTAPARAAGAVGAVPPAPVPEPAPEPAHEEVRGPARMPVPPLLSDLAGWGWRLLVIGAVAVLLLQIAQRLYLVSLPIAAALLMTALLSPVVAALRRHGWPRVAATAVTVVGMVLAVVALLAWIVQRAIAEVPRLSAELQRAVADLPISNSTLLGLREQFLTSVQSGTGSLVSGVLTGVQTAATVLTGIVLTLLLTTILLADGDRMWVWLVTRLPATARVRAMRAGAPAWARLSGWVRGTFLIALFHSTVVAVTLLLLGVPLVAPLAVLVFLGSFIPLVGALLSAGLAVLVTFASQGLTPAILLVIVLLIDNQVEAHVLQPFLVGRYVRLHPFVVAVVITAGALLGGLAGALLAVPFTAAAYAALTNLADPPPPRRVARPRRVHRHRPAPPGAGPAGA